MTTSVKDIKTKKKRTREAGLNKKLYEPNKWWNDWIFQLHWDKLEWVDPKTLIKRYKPYSVSSKEFNLNINDRTDHLVGHY